MEKISDELNKSFDRIDALNTDALAALDRLSWKLDAAFGLTFGVLAVMWIVMMVAIHRASVRARSSTG